jgi:hypothetical protein
MFGCNGSCYVFCASKCVSSTIVKVAPTAEGGGLHITTPRRQRGLPPIVKRSLRVDQRRSRQGRGTTRPPTHADLLGNTNQPRATLSQKYLDIVRLDDTRHFRHFSVHLTSQRNSGYPIYVNKIDRRIS